MSVSLRSNWTKRAPIRGFDGFREPQCIAENTELGLLEPKSNETANPAPRVCKRQVPNKTSADRYSPVLGVQSVNVKGDGVNLWVRGLNRVLCHLRLSLGLHAVPRVPVKLFVVIAVLVGRGECQIVRPLGAVLVLLNLDNVQRPVRARSVRRKTES